MPLATGLQVIASLSGYCQSFPSLHSAGMGRSFGKQSLHLGRFPKFTGLMQVTLALRSASLWQNPHETKTLREAKCCAYYLLFRLPRSQWIC